MKNADLFKNTFGMYATEIWSMSEKDFLKWLNEDVKPKTGHWIDHDKHIECDKCNTWFLKDHLIRKTYCPNCGAKMVKSPESEEV